MHNVVWEEEKREKPLDPESLLFIVNGNCLLDGDNNNNSSSSSSNGRQNHAIPTE